jgi:excisionase family DNA binding protein
VDRRGFVVSLRSRLHERRVAELPSPAVELTLTEACRYAHLGKTTLCKAIVAGELPAFTHGRRQNGYAYAYRIRQDDLARWVRDRPKDTGRHSLKPAAPGFGAYLRGLREARGLTQVQVSQMTGFKQRSMSVWETGRHHIQDVRVIGQLARAMELSPYERLQLFDLAAEQQQESGYQKRRKAEKCE